MEEQTSLHKTGAPVIDRAAATCLLRGAPTQNLPAADVRPLEGSQEVISQCAPEHRIQVRPPMVGNVPALVEWS